MMVDDVKVYECFFTKPKIIYWICLKIPIYCWTNPHYVYISIMGLLIDIKKGNWSELVLPLGSAGRRNWSERSAFAALGHCRHNSVASINVFSTSLISFFSQGYFSLSRCCPRILIFCSGLTHKKNKIGGEKIIRGPQKTLRFAWNSKNFYWKMFLKIPPPPDPRNFVAGVHGGRA